MNKKVTIEELDLTESGVLTGGFVSLSPPDSSESLLNTNCTTSDGWVNYNCGCGACGMTGGSTSTIMT